MRVLPSQGKRLLLMEKYTDVILTPFPIRDGTTASLIYGRAIWLPTEP